MGRIAEAMKRAEAQRRVVRRIAPLDAPPSSAAVIREPAIPAAAPARRAESPNVGVAAGRVAETAPGCSGFSSWHPGVLAKHDPSGQVAEQFRSLRTRLMADNPGGEHRVLAISAAIPREGATLATANLAVAFAEIRHLGVIAIDANLRTFAGGGLALSTVFGPLSAPAGGHRLRPRIRTTRAATGLKPSAATSRQPSSPFGLVDVLAGRCALADAIYPTALPNLSILPAGRLDRESPGLLSSPALRQVLNEIRDSFAVALVDTPPVQSASDVAMVGPLCHGLLMVVRLQRAAAGIVLESVRWLQAHHVHVLGCVAVGATRRGRRLSYPPDAV